MGKGRNFKSVGTKRNFELVIRELRGMLESGRLRPGERLPSEPKLALKFGVSRTALREALKVLELSGHLEVRRGYGGGTFVARPTAEEFRMVAPSPVSLPEVTPLQLSQVCLAIEPRAAGIAAEADLREVGSLEDSIREMEVFDDRPARVLEANSGFHIEVARASGNPVFVAILEELRLAVYRRLNLLVRDSEWREARREEHARIVEEITAGDGEGAERAMRRHLENELGVGRETGA
ncbi:MAG: FadR/GntR family transcriptional regulator [Rubrobacteraceae bacterium]